MPSQHEQKGTIIDSRGFKCPLPVLKLEKHLETATTPLPVTLLADDPVARIDVPVLCNTRNLTCAIHETDGTFRFEIGQKIS